MRELYGKDRPVEIVLQELEKLYTKLYGKIKKQSVFYDAYCKHLDALRDDLEKNILSSIPHEDAKNKEFLRIVAVIEMDPLYHEVNKMSENLEEFLRGPLRPFKNYSIDRVDMKSYFDYVCISRIKTFFECLASDSKNFLNNEYPYLNGNEITNHLFPRLDFYQFLYDVKHDVIDKKYSYEINEIMEQLYIHYDIKFN